MIIHITRGFCVAGSTYFCHSLVHLRRSADAEAAPAYRGRTTTATRVFRRVSSTHNTHLFSFLALRAHCDIRSDLGSQLASQHPKPTKKALSLQAAASVVPTPGTPGRGGVLAFVRPNQTAFMSGNCMIFLFCVCRSPSARPSRATSVDRRRFPPTQASPAPP